MDKPLEMWNIQRPNQEEIENVNRTINSNDVESVIKKTYSQQTKVQDQMALEVNSTNT